MKSETVTIQNTASTRVSCRRTMYFIRVLDAMCAHLASGTPLPPSQVVGTTPRGALHRHQR